MNIQFPRVSSAVHDKLKCLHSELSKGLRSGSDDEEGWNQRTHTHTKIGTNKDAFRIELLRLLAVMCGTAAGWEPGKCDFVSVGGVGGLFQSTRRGVTTGS